MDDPRILVVEDESLIRAVLTEVLIDAGFDVDDAGDGHEAQELIDKDGYRLIVTDVQMPGKLDGIDVAAYARAAKPGIPIIFVTGRPESLLKFRGSTSRVAFLMKPYLPSEIVDAVRQLLSVQQDQASGRLGQA